MSYRAKTLASKPDVLGNVVLIGSNTLNTVILIKKSI